jgi:hypothetical protein
MANKRTLMATYGDSDSAQTTVEEMVEYGYNRQHIGYAVADDSSDDPGEALVTVTVEEGNVNEAMQFLNRHGPLRIDERVTQWKLDEPAGEAGEPSEHGFTAPPRATN